MPADLPIQRFKPKDIIEGRVLPHTTVRYCERAGLRELDGLDTGVLFVLAWWSGPAHVALDHLARAILNTAPAPSFEVILVDTDGIPELYDCELLRGKIHGYGESVWKRKGKVVDTLVRVGQVADYEQRIDQVFE